VLPSDDRPGGEEADGGRPETFELSRERAQERGGHTSQPERTGIGIILELNVYCIGFHVVGISHFDVGKVFSQISRQLSQWHAACFCQVILRSGW